MRKIILKLIPFIMLVSLTSVGFAFWAITSPTIDRNNNGNVVVDEVVELDILSSSYAEDGLRYNRKGFFTQYIYSDDLSGFETKTYDNFTYYVNVNLPKLNESSSMGKVELKIELTSEIVDLNTIKDLLVITSTTNHQISDPVVIDGKLCVYVTFDVTSSSVIEKVGINYNFSRVDSKPEEGQEEAEEELFIKLSNLNEDKKPFVVTSSLYTKSKE